MTVLFLMFVESRSSSTYSNLGYNVVEFPPPIVSLLANDYIVGLNSYFICQGIVEFKSYLNYKLKSYFIFVISKELVYHVGI